MRNKQVEPYVVIMGNETFEALGEPLHISGVPVDVNSNMRKEWYVR